MVRVGHGWTVDPFAGVVKDGKLCGPGILDLAHQPDEFVGIEDMVESAEVMALALAHLLPGTAAA